MKVAIIGQGYVGLTIAAFASKVNQVVGLDNSAKVVERLNQGISHICFLNYWNCRGSAILCSDNYFVDGGTTDTKCN